MSITGTARDASSAPTGAAASSDLFVYRRLDEGQLAHYAEHGYVRVGRTLSDRGLAVLREQCKAAWERHKAGAAFDPSRTWLQNSLLSNVHHHADAVRRFYFAGPLVDVAEQLIGPNVKGSTAQLTFKLRGNTMPFGWHQDNGYGQLDPYNTVSTLTALDDADEENGCLWVIPASHKGGQIPVVRTPEMKKAGTEVVVQADDSKAIPVPMKAGESIAMHCWTLHKSEANRSTTRDRRLLFLRYSDADAVEVYNDRKPRLGRLLRGRTKFPEVEAFEAHLPIE